MGVRLLYLTSRWPDPPGEAFLSNEIRDLAPHFSEIVIVPIDGPVGISENVRDVPSNVSVRRDIRDSVLNQWNKMGTMGRLMLGINHPFWTIGDGLMGRPFSMRRSIGEMGQANLFSKTIRKNLNLDEFGAVATFWLSRTATICALLKINYPHLVAFSRAHGMDIYAQRSGLNRLPLQAGTVRKLDGVRADSKKGVRHLQQTHNKAKNIAIGRLGVDDQQPINGSRDGVLRILSVSSIIGVKRVNLIAEALVNVSRTVHWTHIGDGELRKELEEIIDTLPSNIIVELKGWIPNNQLMGWIGKQEFDLFMNVSSSEGLPVSIMEAFSFGIPALVTAVGGNPEIVQEGAGILLDENPSINSITQNIENWDVNNLERRGIALRIQREEYSSEKNQEEFAKEILHICVVD